VSVRASGSHGGRRLEAEKVAYDFGAYRDAPPGFRFWGGPAVEKDDLALALEWLKWAYEANKPA
jgi:phosphoserine aminotransferase